MKVSQNKIKKPVKRKGEFERMLKFLSKDTKNKLKEFEIDFSTDSIQAVFCYRHEWHAFFFLAPSPEDRVIMFSMLSVQFEIFNKKDIYKPKITKT